MGILMHEIQEAGKGEQTAEETLGYDEIAERIQQHDAAAEDCRVEAVLKPDDTITLAIGPYTGDMGSPLTVSPTGGDVVLSGLSVDVTLNIADADAYTELYNFLVARGRYVLEVCNMDQFGGD